MKYNRVFIYCLDAGELAELVPLLSERLPNAVILTCRSKPAAETLIAGDTRFDLVIVSARGWDPVLFGRLGVRGRMPPPVFLLQKNERYPEQVFFSFKYCLQAPFKMAQVRWLLNELTSPEILCLKDWDFLLLKIDFRYVKLSCTDIRKIERKGTLAEIILVSGATYQTFMSVTRLLALLPSARFVQIKRGTIVSLEMVTLEGDHIVVEDDMIPKSGKWVRGALLEYRPGSLAGISAKQ